MRRRHSDEPAALGCRGEQGSAVVLLLVVGAMASFAVGGFMVLGRDALDATRAQTAADAAALAATTGGEPAARRLAAAGGGTVGIVVVGLGRAEVFVSVGSAGAAAAALRPPPTRGVGSRSGLAPAMLAALTRAEELLGIEVPVVSGYRSPAEQRRLWERRAENPYPVASPGTSLHERGLAIDVPLRVVNALSRVAALSGLCHPLPERDPVHFSACQTP